MSDDTGWVPDACTLPTADQPVRVAEFDALFASAVRAVNRLSPNRLQVVIDEDSAQQARELADREVACCSFFSFQFSEHAGPGVLMEVAVPDGRVDVLDAVTARIAEVQQ